MCTTLIEPPWSQGMAWPAGEQSHLCLFAGIGGVATGIHHMMPNTKCHAVDNSQVALDLFKRRCPWADTTQEDVSNMDWWKHACGSPPILITLSPPCPPFSSAGLRKWLSDWRTLVWRDALLLLHMLRPPLVIIENVHGITTSEKGALAAAIDARVSSFGYLTKQTIVDAKSFVPIARRRWFMLAIRNDLVKHDSAATLSQLTIPTQAYPSSWCIWPALDNPATRAAVWTQDAHRIYNDPAHTPAWARKRIVTPGETLPPILTTYGVAPYLPAGTLGSAAIYGYGTYALLRNKWCPRHLTAAELAAAHGLPDWNSPLWCSSDLNTQAALIRALGDAITPAQAVWRITLLLQAAHWGPQCHPTQVVSAFLLPIKDHLSSLPHSHPQLWPSYSGSTNNPSHNMQEVLLTTRAIYGIQPRRPIGPRIRLNTHGRPHEERYQREDRVSAIDLHIQAFINPTYKWSRYPQDHP